jgi:hypothetical protein
MLHSSRDSEPIINISIEHIPDQVDAVLGEGEERNTKRMVENLINVVEGIFLIYDCI